MRDRFGLGFDRGAAQVVLARHGDGAQHNQKSVLPELAYLPPDLMDRLLQRLKVMANMISDQLYAPEEGHVMADPALGTGELDPVVGPRQIASRTPVNGPPPV